MSCSPGTSGHRYITIVRTPYPGYRVNVPRPGQPASAVSKLFCGHRCSLDVYLARALAWRDVTYFSLHARPVPERVFHERRAQSTTGVPGVRRVVKITRRRLVSGVVRKYEVPCIVAEIRGIPVAGDPDRRTSRSRVFSIAKHGEEKALHLATVWRTQTCALSRLPPKEPSVARLTRAVSGDATDQYIPGRLLDAVADMIGVTPGIALARALGITSAELSRVRHSRHSVGASVLLRLHEVSGLSTILLRQIAQDRRHRYRPSGFKTEDPQTIRQRLVDVSAL
jgi:hypothetical protein